LLLYSINKPLIHALRVCHNKEYKSIGLVASFMKKNCFKAQQLLGMNFSLIKTIYNNSTSG